MRVVEMRMIHWICGHTRIDIIRNVMTRDQVGVTPIEDKMREARLKWFGHIRSRSEDTPIRRCEKVDLPGCRRGQGRPKRSWSEVNTSDLKTLGLTEDIAQNKLHKGTFSLV